MNYYKHHIGDYDSHTAHLSWLEDAAYSRLMRLYYRSEAPPPVDVAKVCRLVRANSKAERDAVEAVLHEFFELGPDGWRNARCDAEIDAARAKADKNRQVGKLGGRPQKKETMMVSENNHDGFQTETEMVSENNPSHKPLANSHKPEKKKRGARAETPCPDDFAISDSVRAWAAQRGVLHLEARLENFVGKARAKGYTYANWDQAFRNAIADDWAGLNGKPHANGHGAQTDDWLSKVMAGAENGARQ